MLKKILFSLIVVCSFGGFESVNAGPFRQIKLDPASNGPFLERFIFFSDINEQDDQYYVGFMYRDGDIRDEKGNIYCLDMGNYSPEELRMSVDPEESFKWVLAEAEAGDALAQYAVGSSYNYGDGVEVDHEKAVTWLEKSAEKAIRGAFFELSHNYYRGLGVKKDLIKAYMYRDLALEEKDCEPVAKFMTVEEVEIAKQSVEDWLLERSMMRVSKNSTS